jgi:hypothetical protein
MIWIDVNDETPQEGIDVLVNTRLLISMGAFVDGYWHETTSKGMFRGLSGVTHWMKLPNRATK